jgi:aspartyl-tRNA(Asn)/glutamyl-tRNA(Gln) amidotransferase subunit C
MDAMLASAMPAGFTKTDVERVANLARLRLTDEEKALFAQQLGTVLDYAGQVRELDTTGVTATSHVLAAEPVDRPDEVRPSLTETQALANAPEPAIAEGLFKVPRVLGG